MNKNLDVFKITQKFHLFFYSKPMFASTSSSISQSVRDQSEKKKTILTPRELFEQSNKKMEEKYVVEKYKVSVELAVKDIEKIFKDYEKNPEKHPKYGEEWKSFWSRRYKELLAQGKDANGHDYKPEWVEFWTKRMKELLKIDISKKKEIFRKKFGLSIEAAARVDSSFAFSRDRRSRSKSRSPVGGRRRRRSGSLVEISDDSDDDRRQSPRRNKRYRFDSKERYPKKSEERSRSYFRDENTYSRNSDNRFQESFDCIRPNRDEPEIHDNGPVSLISVCRLLSALESELGLLAKDVLDLLTKAVSFEKSRANSADELLFNTSYNTLLETVREKLKGVLTANFIQGNKITAVKRAIQNISTLLFDVSKRKPHIKIEKVADYPNDDVDLVAAAKLEIAQVITESLIAQGRTDFTKDELESLVESFISSQNDDAEANETEESAENMPIKSESKPIIKSESKSFIKSETEISSSVSIPKKTIESESNSDGGLANLTDEDLQTLLKSFSDLKPDEQAHLINYLAKIEKANPRRVEKLRKYVNIGDDSDLEDDIKEDNNIDMDIASGVSEPSTSGRKSPEPLRRDLSDDEYDDDAMAKKLGSKSFTNGKSNIIKDNLGLANSLMNSLQSSMQSSETIPIKNWNDHQDFPGTQMQQQQFYAPQYQMNESVPYYAQQMNMPNMGINMGMGMHNNMQMQPMTMALNNSPWLQNASTNFFKDAGSSADFSQKNSNEKQAFKKRHDSFNNRQLTGKGKFKR